MGHWRFRATLPSLCWRTPTAGGRRLLGRLAAAWLLPGLVLGLVLGPRTIPSPGGILEIWSWVALVLSVLVGLRYSAGPRLAAAIQSGWLAAGWTAVANLLALGAVAMGASLNAPKGFFVAAIASSQVLPGILTELQLRRRFEWARKPMSNDAVCASSATIWAEGLHYAVPNLAGAALQMSTPAIFAHWGGYTATAAYSVLLRLYGLAVQGQAMVLAPLWPAYAEAEAKGNRAWVRRTFAISLAITAACMLAICACAGLLPWITSYWLGASSPAIGAPFAWLISLWCCVTVANQALSYLLLGLGELKRIARGVGVAHLATLGLMAAGGHYYGAIGVAAGLTCGAALLATPQFVACTARVLAPDKGSTAQ